MTDLNRSGFKNILGAGIFLAVFIVPIVLLWQGIIPLKFRAVPGILFCVYMAWHIFFYRKFSWKDLGMRTDNFKSSILPYALFTLFCVALMVIFSHFHLLTDEKSHCPAVLRTKLPKSWFFASYVFLTAPIQEVFYQSVFFAEFKKRGISLVPLILISSLNFSVGHIFYSSLAILAITFSVRIFWGLLYNKHQNLWLVALSHSILGAVAIYLKIMPH